MILLTVVGPLVFAVQKGWDVTAKISALAIVLAFVSCAHAGNAEKSGSTVFTNESMFGAGGAAPTSANITARSPILGYQLDISRSKVPTMETLYRIVDIMAKLGYNHFELYTEHTFAYKGHETVWREASPMMPDEVRALDDYCLRCGIELVPNQNSFGHLEQWLRHPEYNGLANHPQGGAHIAHWGGQVRKYPATLNPIDPRSIELVAGLYDQLFPCFRSNFVNVGCDETVELEDLQFTGRSAEALREKGAAKVYFDFLKKIYTD